MAAQMMPYPLPSKSPMVPPHHAQLPFNHLLCRYRSKVCTHPRANKRDGSLHRYCEEHRQRANTNQKKWAQRRMQAVDESEMRRLQLSYQWIHSQQLMTPQCIGSNIDHVPTPPMTETSYASPCTWMDAELDFELPTFEVDMASELLWESPEPQALIDGADVKFEL
jgi:hypothetical protein